MSGTLAVRRYFRLAAALLAGVVAILAQPAVAQEAASTPAPAELTTLTGDWGGKRTQLQNFGIDVSGGVKEEAGGNVYGTIPRQWAQSGEFDFAATFDAQKLWGVPGGVLQTTITLREGEPPPGALLQQSAEVFGRGNIARLTQFWWRQKFLGDRLTIKVGRMPQGDFNNFSCDFMNLTFCGAPGGNIVGSYWYNWPIAQWAGWARYDFGDFNAGAGAYESNPHDLDQQCVAGLTCCATGAMGHFELGWTPSFGGLVGHYQAGVWDDTSGGPDVLLGPDGKPFAVTGMSPLHRSNSYGVYVQGQQQLTGSAVYDRDGGWKVSHGLSLFANFVQADRETSTLDNQFAAGLTYVGPWDARPADTLGFAVGRTGYNSRAAAAILAATPGVETPRAEYPIEVFYSFQATPWWDVRPDFQYVIHPGCFEKAHDEALIGVRSDLKF